MRILLIAGPGEAESIAAPLAGALASSGGEVTVLAPPRQGMPDEAARLTWVAATEYAPMIAEAGEALAAALEFNVALIERGASVLAAGGADVAHALGASVAYAAASLRRAFGVPLVSSLPIAASGSAVDVQTEWWLAAESRRVIVPSVAARARMASRYSLDPSRAHVVPRLRANPSERALATLARRTLEVYERAAGDRHAEDGPTAALPVEERAALRDAFARAGVVIPS